MLTRWDPFSEMASMREAVNRLFDESFARRPGAWSGSGTVAAGASLPFDLYETGDDVVLRVAAPGIDPQALDVTVNQGSLTLKGYRNFYNGDQEKGHTWHMRGLTEGQFAMAIHLPVSVDAGAAAAAYTDGILTITLPKADTAKAKRIAVTSAQSQAPRELASGAEK